MKLILSAGLFLSLFFYPRAETLWGKWKPLPGKEINKITSKIPLKTKAVDSFHGVKVYENGGWRQIHGRNVSADGYNFGLKWQCVEFVKRYYFLHLNHEMPDTYGNAKDFFDITLEQGDINSKRNLLQFINGSDEKPRKEDIIVFGPTVENPYGHIAIVMAVQADRISIIQQNWPNQTRMELALTVSHNQYFLNDYPVLGWMRKS